MTSWSPTALRKGGRRHLCPREACLLAAEAGPVSPSAHARRGLVAGDSVPVFPGPCRGPDCSQHGPRPPGSPEVPWGMDASLVRGVADWGAQSQGRESGCRPSREVCRAGVAGSLGCSAGQDSEGPPLLSGTRKVSNT